MVKHLEERIEAVESFIQTKCETISESAVEPLPVLEDRNIFPSNPGDYNLENNFDYSSFFAYYDAMIYTVDQIIPVAFLKARVHSLPQILVQTIFGLMAFDDKREGSFYLKFYTAAREDLFLTLHSPHILSLYGLYLLGKMSAILGKGVSAL